MNAILLLLLVQGEPLSGDVLSVSADGKSVRASLGRASGIRVKDGLRIFSAPEIVTLPGTDRAAFANEREIGAATVVEVLEKELVAQVTGALEPILRGFRVVPGKPIRSGPLPPHLRETLVLDPPEAAWGREVAMTIDVEDLDGDLAWLELRADSGLVLTPRSTAPRLRWLPPAAAGEAKLTVRAVDRQGLVSERAYTVRCAGVSSAARPASYAMEAVVSAPFLRAADLALDAQGNAWILDGDLRRVVKWTPSGARAWVSDSFGREIEPTRLVVAGSDALLLDRLGRRVLRYALDPSMFLKGPSVVYGGRRHAPGSLRNPVDVAVLPAGDVWVLDAAEGTVKTFAPDGSYQTTLGSFQGARAMRAQGAAVHVLDAGARQFLTFEGGRLVRRTPLAGDQIPVDFLDPANPLHRDRWGALKLSGAVAVRRDAYGRTYAVDEGGRSVLRLEDSGRREAPERGATQVRALPDGGFALEDGATRRTFDADGWLIATARAGGPWPRAERDPAGAAWTLSERELRRGSAAIDLGRLEIVDFDADPFGRVLILERGTGRVYRLTPLARPE